MVFRPSLTILVLAPLLGESLSTATPPLDVLLWGPVVLVPLYGCGALLVRELSRRYGRGLILLAAAYAVYEEALVDGYWFDPGYAEKVGIGGYSRVGGTNLLIAAHLTVFHVVVSIGASIVIVERLFPAHRKEPWVPGKWLVVPLLAFASVPVVTAEDYVRGPVIAPALLFGLLVVAAFVLPRRGPRPRPRAEPGPRLAGLLAFACSGAHFVLVYTVPHLPAPWPAGLVAALFPVALGAWLVPRLSPGSALPGVTGVLVQTALVAAAVGLGGRYDLTVWALVVVVLLWWLNRGERQARLSAAAPR
ncbi:hypothetical protein [Cryptosporangium phraense]|uniref:Uncharacterized protein n=1 Tax=Cryptosporangium phraense TaxID=2593070 RepID=A0A545AGF6_9ACTN|nr:hypothetical protein [Cryptosporangium phraense]TQS40384.1 hypothetical protein FL583_35215 [Cryptosporangium phraense]